jgi:recombinational DNA repair protein (RecF pathway)
VQGYRDDGVVLRTQKLGEADRIITLLTRHNGRVRAVARGVRRTKSRFGARLEPFTHVDVMVHSGRSLDVITQAEVIRAYGTPLASNYPKYTAGTAMLETAERFTPVEKEPAIRQFLLLIGGLRALGDAVDPVGSADSSEPGELAGSPVPVGPAVPADRDDPAPAADDGTPGTSGGAAGTSGTPGDADGTHGPSGDAEGSDAEGREGPVGTPGTGEAPRDPRMVLDAYFLRSLTFAGYAPALEACARCGALSPAAVSGAAVSGAAVSGITVPGITVPGITVPGTGAAADRERTTGTTGTRGTRGTRGTERATGTSSAEYTERTEGPPVGTKPLVAFAIPAGGMVCAGCRPPGAASPAPQTVGLMVALLRGDWEEAMRSERRHRVECSGLVAAYLQWHLEHSIRSLRHVERA